MDAEEGGSEDKKFAEASTQPVEEVAKPVEPVEGINQDDAAD